MIRISTKTRYALRALLEMALRKDKQFFQLSELSRHQQISRKYLELIFATLKKHRIVSSKVGKNGGFYLPQELEKITILKVLEVLEGPVDIVNCANCGRKPSCHTNPVWHDLNNSIIGLLASKNLKNLAEEIGNGSRCLTSFV